MHSYTILKSWYQTNRLMKFSAEDLEKRREKLWLYLQSALTDTPALSELAGRIISEFPIITPDKIRENILAWNSAGIADNDARQAAEDAEKGGKGEIKKGIIAGYSTGTSGTRGLFLASAQERAIYMGQSMAKLLPASSLYGGVRIMLFLRANSKLYSNGKRSGFFQFSYCSLDLKTQEKLDAINAFQPTILIAPSHVLMEIAEAGASIPSLAKYYYGAEPLGEQERLFLQNHFGQAPHPIYQATEGFLAAPCKHGRLHLNEDSLNIEAEAVAGTSGHQIIVTDLHRKTQPIVRVKLDDFIEFDPIPCQCGFGGRTIKPVSGRVQNLWRFENHIITPRQVTESLERSLGAQAKWMAVGTPDRVELKLRPDISNAHAKIAIHNLQHDLNLSLPIDISTLNDNFAQPKRHRVQWRDQIHGT